MPRHPPPEQGLFDLLGGPERPAPARNTFHRGDAFAFLESLPSASVDLVVTDPPYESLELHRAKGTTTRLTGDWFNVVPNAMLPQLLGEVARVLKPDRHFYLFCDEITADVIKAQQGITATRDADGARSCACGLRYWRELIWAKTSKKGSIHGGMGYHYRSACERILFFEKGKRKLGDLGVPDVLVAPRPDHKAPAGKPLSVVETLVRQSTVPGELVLDPFAGSGVLGRAAAENGRDFWLNDLDDSYLLPAVKAMVAPRAPRFLTPQLATSHPSVFLSALVEAKRANQPLGADVTHDVDVLRLDSPEGAALVEALVGTRERERDAPFRRFLRASTWLKAAVQAREAGTNLHVHTAAWLQWSGA